MADARLMAQTADHHRPTQQFMISMAETDHTAGYISGLWLCPVGEIQIL